MLRDRYALSDGYRTGILPMGANVGSSVINGCAANLRDTPWQFNSSLPFVLMVGTLEPRKGHRDIVAAFGELWKSGRQDRLVLVGRRGWHVEDLCDQILSHPQYGEKLIWLDDVNDEELGRIYGACEGVIMASHAEGFGLPLIEALDHGKPVLARNLPIFRSHEEHGVRYFPTKADASELAVCLTEWIDDLRANRIRVSKPDGCWRLSARELFRLIA
jgi:glycosyltransferase involved in cell wall biosynthesis